MYEDLKKLFDNGIEMYKYYLDGKLVGFISIDLRAMEIKIKDIVVLPEYQQLGIGTKLLDFVKQCAQENNIKKILLGMIYDNEKLRLWYLKYGFKITNIIKYPNSDTTTCYMELIIN